MWPFGKLEYKERLSVDELDALDPTDPESAKKIVEAPIEDVIALEGRALAREASQEDLKWSAVAEVLARLDTRLSKLERLVLAHNDEMKKAGIPIIKEE